VSEDHPSARPCRRSWAVVEQMVVQSGSRRVATREGGIFSLFEPIGRIEVGEIGLNFGRISKMSPWCTDAAADWQQAGHARRSGVIGTGRPVAEVGDEVARVCPLHPAQDQAREQDRLLDFGQLEAGRSPHDRIQPPCIVDLPGFLQAVVAHGFPAFARAVVFVNQPSTPGRAFRWATSGCVVLGRVGMEQVAIPEDLRPDDRSFAITRWPVCANHLGGRAFVPENRRAPCGLHLLCAAQDVGQQFPLRAGIF